MKNTVLTALKRSITKPVVLLFGIAIIAVSCQKNEIESINEFNSESNIEQKLAPGTLPIAQIAIDNGFSELVAALSYVDFELNAGLVDMFMNGTDQYTVFAPTNQAFMNLYTALNVNAITDLDEVLVLNVLKYHVVEGRRSSKSVVPPVKPRKIDTLLGVSFTVDKNGMITAVGNTANIIAADISASNGIVHVIDAVILPVQ